MVFLWTRPVASRLHELKNLQQLSWQDRMMQVEADSSFDLQTTEQTVQHLCQH